MDNFYAEPKAVSLLKIKPWISVPKKSVIITISLDIKKICVNLWTITPSVAYNFLGTEIHGFFKDTAWLRIDITTALRDYGLLAQVRGLVCFAVTSRVYTLV